MFSFHRVSTLNPCVHLYSTSYMLHALPIKEVQSPALAVPPLSHPTSCTPTRSNLYLSNSLTTVISDPDLYRLVTFHVTNLISLAHRLVLHRRISPVSRPLCMNRNMFTFLRWGDVSTSPNTQVGGPPLVGCPRLLIQNIRSYPPYLEAVPPTAT